MSPLYKKLNLKINKPYRIFCNGDVWHITFAADGFSIEGSSDKDLYNAIAKSILTGNYVIMPLAPIAQDVPPFDKNRSLIIYWISLESGKPLFETIPKIDKYYPMLKAYDLTFDSPDDLTERRFEDIAYAYIDSQYFDTKRACEDWCRFTFNTGIRLSTTYTFTKDSKSAEFSILDGKWCWRKDELSETPYYDILAGLATVAPKFTSSQEIAAYFRKLLSIDALTTFYIFDLTDHKKYQLFADPKYGLIGPTYQKTHNDLYDKFAAGRAFAGLSYNGPWKEASSK